jgi:hypothetical protein
VIAGGCGGSDDRSRAIWLGPEEWDPLACAWEDQLDGGGGLIDSAGEIALTADGEVVVGGGINPSAQEHRTWFRRYSRTGEVVWTTDSALPGFRGWFNALVLDDQGRIGLTGTITDENYREDFWVAALEASGELAWSIELDTGGGGQAACFAPGGELYVTGAVTDTEHNSASFLWLGKLAADGTLLWEHTEPAAFPGQNEGQALVCDESGGVIVVGDVLNGVTYSETWVRRYDPDGASLWMTTFSDPQGTSPDAALLDGARREVLIAVQFAASKRLYRLALSDGAITAELPAPEQRILAADDGGTFVEGNFAFDADTECEDPLGDPCQLVPYRGYAYYDWNAELVWWRAATAGIPNDEAQNAVHALAAGDGGRVLVGAVQDDIWVCHE